MASVRLACATARQANTERPLRGRQAQAGRTSKLLGCLLLRGYCCWGFLLRGGWGSVGGWSDTGGFCYWEFRVLGFLLLGLLLREGVLLGVLLLGVPLLGDLLLGICVKGYRPTVG